MDTNSSIRTMLANGSIRDILDELGMDRTYEVTVMDIMTGQQGTILMAQVGRSVITLMPSGIAQVGVHHHDETLDEQCWTGLVQELDRTAAEHNAMAESITSNPLAWSLARLGAPPEVIEEILNGSQPVAETPTASVALPSLSRDDAPGFYL